MASETVNQRDTKHVSAPAPEVDIEKHSSKHEEHEDKVRREVGDYSGAVGKTSPEEVKLVRKLDLWIMVSSSIHPTVYCKGL